MLSSNSDESERRVAKILRDSHSSQPHTERGGKWGEGSESAMAHIRTDRVAELEAAMGAEDQIKTLWLLRVEADRNFTGVKELAAWVTENAPELLQGRAVAEAPEYLLCLLRDELHTNSNAPNVNWQTRPLADR